MIDRRKFKKWCGFLLGGTLFASAAFTVKAQSSPHLHYARRLTGAAGAQGRLMWVDGTANIFRTVDVNGSPIEEDYTTTQSGVDSIVAHCAAAHINTIVVDVKPLGGQVLYNSSFAPHLTMWKGRPVPNFDVLAAFIKAGHDAGLQVDADINILSEGHKYFQTGPAYSHPGWQLMVYTVDRGLIAPDGSRLPLYVEGEPADDTRALLLSGHSSILGGESAGMIGLEITGSNLNRSPSDTVGNELNLVIDKQNRVTGIVDSALLGDDPLQTPQEGSLIRISSPADRSWVTGNLKPGDTVQFNMQTPILPIAQAPNEKVADFVNPLNPHVRKYELKMVHEIVANYDIDGLVLDRCRYADLYTDFSSLTRSAFEQFLGHPVINWPDDIYHFSPLPGKDIISGPLFKQWLQFRAQTIRDFVSDVAQTARSIKPDLVLGNYVGSWYSAYYPVGVNWGSERTPYRFDWFTPDYPSTGYAEYFNWISTGCYYPIATRNQARELGTNPRYTVEDAAAESRLALADGTLLYPGIYVPDYEKHPQEMINALNVCSQEGEGWMIFDLSYITQFHWWPLLEKAWNSAPIPPEKISGLLTAIRSARSEAIP